MALIDILLHFCDRTEDILLCKVAEYAHAYFSTGITPCLGRIVVAVCSREYREVCDRLLNRLTLVLEVCLLSLVWLDILKTCRNKLGMVSLSCVRINLCESCTVDVDKFEDIESLSVDCKLAVLAVSNLSDKNCIRPVKLVLSLNKDRTVAIVEELLLVICDLCIKTVTERHLADSLSNTTESYSIS